MQCCFDSLSLLYSLSKPQRTSFSSITHSDGRKVDETYLHRGFDRRIMSENDPLVSFLFECSPANSTEAMKSHRMLAVIHLFLPHKRSITPFVSLLLLSGLVSHQQYCRLPIDEAPSFSTFYTCRLRACCCCFLSSLLTFFSSSKNTKKRTVMIPHFFHLVDK